MAKYVRPLILRSPENLYLIAETRTFITGFSDAVAQCGKMVGHVLQVMDDSRLTCMVPYYTNLLKESINKGEAYLEKKSEDTMQFSHYISWLLRRDSPVGNKFVLLQR